MITGLVSVVIPAYNVEQYISTSVESLLKQTYKNIEIIIVDDGSMDNTLKKSEEFRARDSRVKVLHQENRGVAQARKAGILSARGKYICFVDADDIADEKMVEFMMNNIGDSDLLTSGCIAETAASKEVTRIDGLAEGIYTGQEMLQEVYSRMVFFEQINTNRVLPYMFGKLFKTDKLESVVQDVPQILNIHEDRALNICYALRCKSICITHEILYRYCYRCDSALRTKHTDYMINLNNYYLLLKKEFEKYPQNNVLMTQLQRFINSRIIDITSFMGFDWQAQSYRYICSCLNHLNGKKVVLYGAGIVGKNYYRQLSWKIGKANVYWTDKNYGTLCKTIKEVKPFLLGNLNEFDYSIIILAVNKQVVADEMKSELIQLGLPEDKIWWEEPISLREY